MEYVEVPVSNNRVWQDRSVVLLTADATAWLEENVGNRQFRHPDSPEYHPPRPHWIIMNDWHPIQVGRKKGTKIFFSDPKLAMLFKLTWL